MKIISLTMNAFLAYKDKTTIDFESMIDHGLYLISGPTGAGKTTIFDAITFVLYGEASGSERNQSYFRSDFADDKEETYVEMTFEIHGQIYTIKRSPTYTRKGYKTPKNANAYFTYKQVTIEGVKEVNQKINTLLGVDVKQFKQIVMIAQGEFTKLIYASSEERERVLRHIFHSEPLVTFENILKEETKQYKDQYFFSNQQLLNRYQLLTLPEDFMKLRLEQFHPSYIEDAIHENEKISKQSLLIQNQYEILKQQYDEYSQAYYLKQKQNQDIIDYQKIDNQYQELLLKDMEMNNLKDDIDQLKLLEQNQSLIDQYKHTNKDYLFNQKEHQNLITQQKEINSRFSHIEKEYNKLSLYNKTKENLILTIENAKQSLIKQKAYQTILLQEEDINKQYLLLNKEYQDFKEENERLVKRIERDQENTSHLHDLQLDLSLSEQKVNEMNQRRIAIHELSDVFDHYILLQDEHYELGKKYKQVSDEYQSILDQYNQEDENNKRQQAGILASTLKEKQACPVCGSLEHPHLASLTLDILTPKQLEELLQAVEVSKNKKEDIYQEVLSQNQNVQETKTQIDLLKKQLRIEDELNKEVFIQLLANISLYINEQEKTYHKKQTEVEYLKKIKSSLEKDRVVLSKQNQKLEDYKNQLHTLELKKTSLKTQLDQYLKDDQQINLESLEVNLNQHEKELVDLNHLLDSITTNYNQCQKELSVITTQLEMNQKRDQELSLSLSQLKTQYDLFIKTYFKTEDNFNKYTIILDTLKEKEEVYQNYIIQKNTLFSRLKELKELTKDKSLIDLSLVEEKLKNLEISRDDVFKDMNHLKHTFEQNASLIKILEKEYKKNQDVFEKYTLYQDLLDMTSGKNPQRLSFERYVLSSYFEHILEYANVELLKMSQGRYAMHRKQMSKGAKQQGLDLSVLDYETGIMRDIQSLSGGESFKAALALALGLSSMIQSYAGGIELNTLFIDEGFGSLDSESIDQALSVLLDLKNDNKVIGIISHVNELKERITTQIVVDKMKNGSTLHIEKE